MRKKGYSKQGGDKEDDDDDVKRPPIPSSKAAHGSSQATPAVHSDASTASWNEKTAFIEHQAVHLGAVPAESTPPAVTNKSPRLSLAAPHWHVGASASLRGDNAPPSNEELAVGESATRGNSSFEGESGATQNESSRPSRYSGSRTSDSSNSRAYSRGEGASHPSTDKSNATRMSGTRRDRWRESDEYGDDRSYDDHDESLSIQVGAIPVKGIGARTPWVADDSLPNDHDTETVTYTTEPNISDVGNMEGLATAILVNEDDPTMMHQLDPTVPYYAAEEIHEDEVQKGFDNFLRRNALKICLCVVVLVIGSILGTTFGIRASKGEETLDAEEKILRDGSKRFQVASKLLLLQSVTDREVLLNASLTTPQYIALKWLADEDEAKTDLTNEVTLIQRYSLAVLFFSSGGGDSWTDTHNFTSALNECEWYSVKAGIRHGVAECSEDGIVTKLRLSKFISGR